MNKLGITHMVSVMEKTPTTMPDVVRHLVPVADSWDEDILKYLDGTTEFIRAALAENQNNKVLVGSWA
jgi:atypical dual specificity phosphatase